MKYLFLTSFLIAYVNGCEKTDQQLCAAILDNNVARANRIINSFQDQDDPLDLNEVLRQISCISAYKANENPLISDPPQYEYWLKIKDKERRVRFYIIKHKISISTIE